MSVEREGGLIVWACDSCPESLDTDTDDFTEARGVMRREGWKAEQVRGEWVHTCAACMSKLGFYPLDRDT